VRAPLRSERFRSEREDDWRRLDRLLKKIEQRSAKGLTDEELLALPVLYRSSMSALASARATSLDLALVQYLESLCSRAYYFVYGVRAGFLERLRAFLTYDLPAEVKAIWRQTLISALLFFTGAIIAYSLVSADPDWFYSIMDRSLSSGRDPSASTEFLRKTLYDGDNKDSLGAFASFLFTHNAQIALWSFGLGFALSVPTAYLIATNGCALGAFAAVFASKGLGFEVGGWLAIHGVTEISAIILAGAAGMRIGWSVGFPGERSRLQAMVASGRRGAIVMGGVVIMLAFAGLLEGFGRQLVKNDLARYAIGAATGLFWLAYFYLPRRTRGLRR
jgi:uncharacterized membrane protein SpoIIM required for sporulation